MKWARHVAPMEQMRNAYKILARKREEKKRLDVDGKMILKLILKKQDIRVWTVFMRHRRGPVAGFCDGKREIH
jgi:hypothetical protein